MPTIEIKTIENTVIGKIKEKNGGKPVGIRHKVSGHVGGVAKVAPFLNELNKAEPFKRDGMRLTFGDVSPDPTVMQLTVAIAIVYAKMGWEAV